MSNSIKVKVCGIKREEDSVTALIEGADFIGINVYKDSPRSVSLDRAEELLAKIPEGKRVVVDVSPDDTKRMLIKKLSFDYFQLHFDISTEETVISEWVKIFGREKLWLAPRIPSIDEFPRFLFDYVDTFLIDAFSENVFGGTGKTGNWDDFAKIRKRYLEKNFILAGGLNPENICDAVKNSGAEHVDVNSGVESEPGVKDAEKVHKFFAALKSGY